MVYTLNLMQTLRFVTIFRQSLVVGRYIDVIVIIQPQSLYYKLDRIHYSMLDVQCSMFDVHQFLFQIDFLTPYKIAYTFILQMEN